MTPEINKPVVRRGDGRNNFLEVELGHEGDVYVTAIKINPDGTQTRTQVEFCVMSGGGYHPKTISALCELIDAMKADNEDPKSPLRYKKTVELRGDLD